MNSQNSIIQIAIATSAEQVEDVSVTIRKHVNRDFPGRSKERLRKHCNKHEVVRQIHEAQLSEFDTVI